MDRTLEELRKRKRRKALKILITTMGVSIVLMFIFPFASMFIGLIVAGAAAYGLSPSTDLYRGFKSAAMLGMISKEAAEDIYKEENEELKNVDSQYGNMIIVTILGLTIFIVSLILLSIGWNGLL